MLFIFLTKQAVCRENLIIIDSFVGWPGRAHDAVTYKGSSLCKELFARTDGFKYVILGDKAYPLSEGLLTPYAGRAETLTNKQKKFNQSVSSIRQVINILFYFDQTNCEKKHYK